MKVGRLREALEKAFTWGYYDAFPPPHALLHPAERELYDRKLADAARDYAQGQIQLCLSPESELEI